MNLAELTIETVQPLVGTTFEIPLADGQTTTLKLDEVLPFEPSVRRRRRSADVMRDPFSLYFLGSRSLILPQGMYTLRSEATTFEGLFLVPIGQGEEATEYEAVFT
jgi:hypothetical protein